MIKKPSLFGKDSKKQELIKNLRKVFLEIHKKYQVNNYLNF